MSGLLGGDLSPRSLPVAGQILDRPALWTPVWLPPLRRVVRASAPAFVRVLLDRDDELVAVGLRAVVDGLLDGRGRRRSRRINGSSCRSFASATHSATITNANGAAMMIVMFWMPVSASPFPAPMINMM